MANFEKYLLLNNDTSANISGAGDTLHTYTMRGAMEIKFIVLVTGLTGDGYITLQPEVDGKPGPATVLSTLQRGKVMQRVESSAQSAGSGAVVNLYVSSTDSTAGTVTLSSNLVRASAAADVKVNW
jgi:hypothetical protein